MLHCILATSPGDASFPLFCMNFDAAPPSFGGTVDFDRRGPAAENMHVARIKALTEHATKSAGSR
jgi:hypothetical protein